MTPTPGAGTAAAITALMTGRAYLGSARVAAAMGPYDRYPENRDAHNAVMRMHRDASYAIPVEDCLDSSLLTAARTSWDEAVAAGDRHGYRNAQATVLAPTGTISFLMDCDTTGVEPDFSLVKFKELVGGGQMTIVNRTVPLALQTLGYSDEHIEQILAYVNEHSTIIGAPGLDAEDLPVFDVAVGERAISHMGHIKMMGAVQPFLSGAISKTVNMPQTATVEDIADAYIQAWRMGVKALAIYRDGSKTAQALRTDAQQGKTVDVDVQAEVEKAVTEALAKVGPKRRRMPRERQSITHKFSIGGHEGYITAGMYEDRTVGEIFLTDIGKEGSTLRGMMNAFATAISLSLQYGVPLETLVRKFSYMRFEPEGMTSNPEIPFSKSMPDYIMRWLASRFLDVDLQEELGILTKEVRARKAAQDAASSQLGDTAGPGVPSTAVTPADATATARDVGADRRAAGAAGGQHGPGSRPGVPAVRRDDAAHRQLLHVRQLRVQHRLRLISQGAAPAPRLVDASTRKAPEIRSLSFGAAGDARRSSRRRRSGSQAAPGLLNRGQGGLRLGQRPRAKVDARRLGGDVDLLAGGRIAALALLLGGLDAHGELDHAADTYLLRVAKLFEDDLVKRPEGALGVGLAQFGPLGDGCHELRLR